MGAERRTAQPPCPPVDGSTAARAYRSLRPTLHTALSTYTTPTDTPAFRQARIRRRLNDTVQEKTKKKETSPRRPHT